MVSILETHRNNSVLFVIEAKWADISWSSNAVHMCNWRSTVQRWED